jgi:hypothetical protein
MHDNDPEEMLQGKCVSRVKKIEGRREFNVRPYKARISRRSLLKRFGIDSRTKGFRYISLPHP